MSMWILIAIQQIALGLAIVETITSIGSVLNTYLLTRNNNASVKEIRIPWTFTGILWAIYFVMSEVLQWLFSFEIWS